MGRAGDRTDMYVRSIPRIKAIRQASRRFTSSIYDLREGIEKLKLDRVSF